MEPSNLNPRDPDDIRLESLIRASASPELPDAGFSSRVVAGLPKSAGSARWWTQRNFFMIAGAGAGLAVALLAGGSPAAVSDIGPILSSAIASLSSVIDQPGAIIALALGVGIVALLYGDEALE